MRSSKEVKLRERLSDVEFLHQNLHFIINVLDRRPDLPGDMQNLLDIFTGYTVFEKYAIVGLEEMKREARKRMQEAEYEAGKAEHELREIRERLENELLRQPRRKLEEAKQQLEEARNDLMKLTEPDYMRWKPERNTRHLRHTTHVATTPTSCIRVKPIIPQRKPSGDPVHLDSGWMVFIILAALDLCLAILFALMR